MNLFEFKHEIICITASAEAKKKNTLVSGNACDKKKHSPGRSQIYFFNQFNWIFQIKYTLK